jgi:branched-chain amino acid transport system permease protein
MESTMTTRSFSERLTIFLRDNLPATVVLAFTVLLAIALSIAAGPAQIVNSIVTGGILALLSAGLALVFGVMNIPHFAHGESFMVGAYVGYFVFTPINDYVQENGNAVLGAVAPLIAVVAAAIFGFVLGIVIEKLVFAPLRHRTREGWVMNTFLLTVGLAFILINGTTLLLGPNYRGIPRYLPVPPLEMLGIRIAADRLFSFVISVITIIGLTWFMQRTRTGRAIRAVAQDETGAQLVGIDLDFVHTLTFALATSTAAMAGAALLYMFQAYPTVGLKPLYLSWYVVMLVGLGNVYGAIVGGFIVALLQAATQQFIGIAWEDVVPTIVMIIILIVVPSGIFGSEVKGVQEQ